MTIEANYDVTMQAIVRYAGASGDFTPVHYDTEALTAAGYDTFFAMGMLAAGRLGGLVATTYGDDSVRSLHTRFRHRSNVGTTVTLRLHPSGSIDDDGCMNVRLEALDDSGTVIADGDARVLATEQTPA
ncbi:MaoC/PaaZ C-terminal domain-containing protein [Gordonia polyisoprenivorans]|uniref:MaoC/PaaZ C-terminal domain-containing protein n=1 Tax=Gordonia polyisoprenivorans TaxID=84595 RepID=UPI001AD65FCD|nr:MaoC/PaaZ C-terminal domain-containing protein [Gordonia polyisoprenivorans]QTI69947.1 MaoC family dehydratase N-terminal domain-containing protein [Gordonia polyisoprenivorans]